MVDRKLTHVLTCRKCGIVDWVAFEDPEKGKKIAKVSFDHHANCGKDARWSLVSGKPKPRRKR